MTAGFLTLTFCRLSCFVGFILYFIALLDTCLYVVMSGWAVYFVLVWFLAVFLVAVNVPSLEYGRVWTFYDSLTFCIILCLFVVLLSLFLPDKFLCVYFPWRWLKLTLICSNRQCFSLLLTQVLLPMDKFLCVSILFSGFTSRHYYHYYKM